MQGRDILIAVVDGLKGPPEAIRSVFLIRSRSAAMSKLRWLSPQVVVLV